MPKWLEFRRFLFRSREPLIVLAAGQLAGQQGADAFLARRGCGAWPGRIGEGVAAVPDSLPWNVVATGTPSVSAKRRSLPIRAKLGLLSLVEPHSSNPERSRTPFTPTLFSFPLILKPLCSPRVRNAPPRQLTSRCGKTDSRRSRLRRCRRRRSRPE